MNMYPLSIVVVLFLCLLIKFTAAFSNPSHFTGDVSINCGSIGTSIANNGRGWVGDVQPKSSSLLQIKGSSTTSTVVPMSISADPVPYKTARISQSQFSYAFQVSPGEKILRFHFKPTSYKGFEGFKDLFTVEAGPFTLLGNFSASLAADALGVDSFVKEFCLHIQENQKLNIIFSPETSQSLDTYVFINGIEIFTVPTSHSYFEGGDIGLQLVGEKSPVYIDSSTALEIFHQIEFKKNNVQSAGDFHGLFPKWENVNAKRRNNNTWKMPVDVGFKYLIRVHLSELGLKIAENGDNTFKVLINEMIDRTDVDVVKGRDENKIPWYRDYTVKVRGNKKEGKRDILISLQYYDDLIDDQVLVSGFEIFKLSNFDNSLASPNPSPLARDSASHTVQTLFLVLYHRNAIADVAIAMISLVCIIVCKLREIWDANTTDEENKTKPKPKPKPSPSPSPSPSARVERTCRRFSLDEQNGLSAQTGQPTIFSTAVQNFTPHPNEQTNSNVVIAQLPQNDNNGLSVQTGQPTIFSTAVQNFAPPLKEQTISNVAIAQLPLRRNELPSISEFHLDTSTPAISKSCSTWDLCRRFSFKEIKTATNNLDDDLIIGKGRLFNVYAGLIEDTATTTIVAIKIVKMSSSSGVRKFLNRINMLSQVRHLNLVSPIGYCDEGGQMILVYDYMVHGCLHDHLYNSEKNTTLKWKRRLRICLGVAVGLHYLHMGNEYNPVMHRGVNSTNILLDEKRVAKVSLGPRYIELRRSTTEDDVHYLGVVLFEVLFAKPEEPINLDKCVEFCKREETLMEKVQPYLGDGTEPYIDSNLYNQIAPKCLSKFVETALSCINEERSKRPAMSDVVRSLEFAMQLQVAEDKGGRTASLR